MPSLAPQPKFRFFTAGGTGTPVRPLVGGKVYFYAAGTTTPKDTYTSSTGLVANTNPVILNSRGEADIWLGDGAYKMLVTDAAGVQQGGTVDGIKGQDQLLVEVATLIDTLRTDLASTASGDGASLVAIEDAAGNYTAAQVEAALAEVATMFYATRYSVEDARWGASSAGTAAANTAAIQACITAAPEGAVIYFPGRYQINDELVVSKCLTFMGAHPGPVYVRASYAGLKQTVAGKACFKLQATTSMYAFGQYGIVGMRFFGLSGEGPSDASFGVGFIRCDTAINGGDFHVRENQFNGLSLRWFTTAIDLTGIAYLNTFRENSVTYCDTAVKIARGAASDVGGQTRFFGGFYGLNRVGLSLNRDSTAAGGDFGLHGVTASENTEYGVMVDEEAILYTSPDCQFESNGIAGIYTEIAEANPNTSGCKTIGGKFLTNGADIWVDKTTTAFADGNFFFPFSIDGAYLGSALGLKVTVPVGHSPLRSPKFSIGRNVAGLTNGSLTPSQVSANFSGTWVREGGVDLTFGASVAVDASLGHSFSVVATSNIAFAIANPTNPGYLQEITITVLNASGGPLGAVTWGTAFKLATWTSPANVFSRSISFRYNGTNWVEISRTPADVPN
jgi:hypothetical protein